MKRFVDLATKYQRLPVHGTNPESDLSGIIEIAGTETLAHLSSKAAICKTRNEKGWFDLVVAGPSGIRILLHNALLRSQTDHGFLQPSKQTRTAYTVYPNLVIFDAGGLVEDSKVRSISFTADGFDAFFSYGALERLSLSEEDAALKALLKAKRRPPFKGGPFKPYDVHLRHGLSAPVRFRLGDARYRIDLSSHVHWQRNQERFELVATATIAFDDPIEIDNAIERVWEWGWFFSQVAFGPLPLTALGVQGTPKSPGGSADFYLPSVAGGEDDTRRDLHAVHIPFCRWRERTHMQRAMQQWFERRKERETFRGVLASVLYGIRRRIDVRHIISLCAAIESLDELVDPGTLTRADVQAMVEAARDAAAARGASVDPQRIASALAMLGRPSLKHRLERLGAALPFIAMDDLKLLIGTVQGLRNGAAHGQAYALMESGLIAPATVGLTAACVLFDLTTSRVPVDFRESCKLKAMSEFSAAMVALRSNGRWA